MNKKEESGGSYTTSGTAILNGKEVKALFTAYYPANTKLQGGFYDAQGNKLTDKQKLVLLQNLYLLALKYKFKVQELIKMVKLIQ